MDLAPGHTSAVRILVIVLLCLVSIGIEPAPAGATSDISERTITLDVQGVAQLLYDHLSDQLYLSAGDEVFVFASNGDIRARIPLPSTAEMDVTDDGRRLWVAMPGADAVVAIDTGSLTVVDRIDFADGFCPRSVVALDDRLVVGTGCQRGRVHLVPLTAPHTPRAQDAGPHHRATLSHHPVMGDVVVAGDLGLSPASIYLMDVSGDAPRRLAGQSKGGNLRQVAVAPSGDQVVQASGSPYVHNAFSTWDLALVHEYSTTNYPNAATWSADGRVLAAGSDAAHDTDIFLFGRSRSTPFFTHELAGGEVPPRGLALNGDATWLYAVSQEFTGSAGNPYNHALEIVRVDGEIPLPPPTPATIRGTIRHTVPGYTDGVARYGRITLLDPETHEIIRKGAADPAGRYELRDVPPGDYLAVFFNSRDGSSLVDFFPELYREAPLLRVSEATPVRAATGRITTADGMLSPLFADMHDSVFSNEIYFLRNTGTTFGCNPPDNTLFCPQDPVTRGQMAAFLSRYLQLHSVDDGISFTDTGGSVFERDILRLATAGITRGCNPPDNDRYCPDQVVTRGQMAAFLVRAFGMSAIDEDVAFSDTGGSVFERDILRLATAGVTRGCNPPDNDRYCPDDPVTRGQMAAFLFRAYEWNLARGQARY